MKMTAKQRQTIKRHYADLSDAAPKRETVEDAIIEFVQRERIRLNTNLPREYCAMLGHELANAVDTIAKVEIIQRYHSLVRLLIANARFENSKADHAEPSANVTMQLMKAEKSAASQGWNSVWNKFNTTIIAIV